MNIAIEQIKPGAKLGFPSKRFSRGSRVPTRGEVWFTIREVQTRMSNPSWVEKGLETPGYYIDAKLTQDSTGKAWETSTVHLYKGTLKGGIYKKKIWHGVEKGYERSENYYSENIALTPVTTAD